MGLPSTFHLMLSPLAAWVLFKRSCLTVTGCLGLGMQLIRRANNDTTNGIIDGRRSDAAGGGDDGNPGGCAR